VCSGLEKIVSPFNNIGCRQFPDKPQNVELFGHGVAERQLFETAIIRLPRLAVLTFAICKILL
jgi:hypothetical protein